MAGPFISDGDEASAATGAGPLDHLEVLDRPNETRFKPELLCALSAPTSNLLIHNLKSMTMLEGFKLQCAKAKNNPWNDLLCYRHNDPGDAKCKFHISIQLKRIGKDNQVYHIATCHLTHSHPNDPLMFAHCAVPARMKEVIKGMASMNVSPTRIATYLRKQTDNVEHFIRFEK
jgi:hypothetical protein